MNLLFEEQFNSNIDIIFNDLANVGILHPESKFFFEIKKKISKSYLHNLYPLTEYYNYLLRENDPSFSLYNLYLTAYASFLDQLLDASRVDPVRKVKITQASSYLLLKYFEYLIKTSNPEIVKYFYEYYSKQTEYLVREKEWIYPQTYISKYLLKSKLHNKEVLLLFPVFLWKINISLKYAIIKKLFINYFSFILLSDDIIDVESDIENQCITYPIGVYYKIKGKWPKHKKNIDFLLPHFEKLLLNFIQNIENAEKDIGYNSIAVEGTISEFRKGLSNRGYHI